MVRHCVALNCSSRDVDHVPGVQLHKFPADQTMKEKWIKAIERDGWTPCGNSRLCSRHFEKECYTMSPFQQMVLKKNAIPTIFNLSADNDEATLKDFLKPYVPRNKPEETKKRSRSKKPKFSSKPKDDSTDDDYNAATAAATDDDDNDNEHVEMVLQHKKKVTKKKAAKKDDSNENSSFDDLSYYSIPESHFICG